MKFRHLAYGAAMFSFVIFVYWISGREFERCGNLAVAVTLGASLGAMVIAAFNIPE